MSVPQRQVRQGWKGTSPRALGFSLLCGLLSCGCVLFASGFATAAAQDPSFEREILPVFSKLGCNAAACHGAAGGRGGFQLSLFGARPREDYRTIVFGEAGRRLQLNRPAESLLLKKPTESISHEGGFLFDVDSSIWNRLVAWIAAGAPYGSPLDIQHLEVEPAVLRGDTVPLQQGLTVWSVAASGEREEVTAWADFLSPDPSNVSINGQGQVTVRRPGEVTIVVRYAGHFATARAVIPVSDASVQPPVLELTNTLDTSIALKLAELHLEFPTAADDSTLLRRYYLDLIGRLPTPEEQAEFARQRHPDRWERLVDRLLASDRFNQYWSFRWSQWLRAPSPPQEPQVAVAFRQWLKESLVQQRGWLEVVTALLDARGDSHTVGPVGYFRSTQDPRLQAERFAETVLGVRMRCANCHDHPLDQWTQDDYHGLAALFAKLSYGRQITDLPRGAVIHPELAAPAIPQLPGEPVSQSIELQVKDLSAWLGRAGEQQVAQHYVNRIWHAMTGQGLVSPLDDWRLTNPPSHPALVTELVNELQRGDWQLRPLVRRVALSSTYRAATMEASSRHHAAFMALNRPRPLGAEVLVDALADFTGIPETVEREPLIRRAVDLVQGNSSSEALTLLGRCPDPGGCADPDLEAQALDLRAALHWVNGSVLNQRLTDREGWLRTSWDSHPARQRLVTQIYQRSLCRAPTPDELAFWLGELDSQATPQDEWQCLQDLTWSLLSSAEFLTLR